MKIELYAGGGSRTDSVWRETRRWCENNPGKTAAVVTPMGMFTVKYESSLKSAKEEKQA